MNHCLRAVTWSLGLFGLSACAGLTGERIVYDQQGIEVGIQSDPTISRSNPPARNSHPATLSKTELRLLMGSLQISGWSGTIMGLVQSPRPVPLLSTDQMDRLIDPLVAALQQAGPTERVSFSLQDKDRPYSPDRTTGMLFIRDPYLHVVMTDHSAFTQADTGGGEEKDIRDTKGMKLLVAWPAQPAAVPAFEEPRWAPFETVHISLNTREVSALGKIAAPARADQGLVSPPAKRSDQPSSPTSPVAAPTIVEDQRSQIRELTSSNLDLRERLDDQRKQMRELKDELTRLQQELEKMKSTSRPSRKSLVP